MDDLEGKDRLLAGALRSLSIVVRELDTEILSPCGESPDVVPLARKVKEVLALPKESSLEELGHDSSLRIRSCGRQLRSLVTGAQTLPKVLSALAEATGTLRDGTNRDEERFRGFADEMDQAAALPDLESVRRKIQLQAMQLVAYVDKISAENRATVRQLEAELTTYRCKLAEVETIAATDPLTGLGNRRSVERRIEALVASSRPFCLLLIDLNRFKYINDTFGHLAGDELLASFAARLKGSLRQADFSARWGGDEFMVVMECALRDAMNRSQQIQKVVCGRYSLSRAAGAPRVDITATIGVAERKEEETAEQLFARTDTLLYAAKPGR